MLRGRIYWTSPLLFADPGWISDAADTRSADAFVSFFESSLPDGGFLDSSTLPEVSAARFTARHGVNFASIVASTLRQALMRKESSSFTGSNPDKEVSPWARTAVIPAGVTRKTLRREKVRKQLIHWGPLNPKVSNDLRRPHPSRRHRSQNPEHSVICPFISG